MYKFIIVSLIFTLTFFYSNEVYSLTHIENIDNNDSSNPSEEFIVNIFARKIIDAIRDNYSFSESESVGFELINLEVNEVSNEEESYYEINFKVNILGDKSKHISVDKLTFKLTNSSNLFYNFSPEENIIMVNYIKGKPYNSN